jgi:hypothetical protein
MRPWAPSRIAAPSANTAARHFTSLTPGFALHGAFIGPVPRCVVVHRVTHRVDCVEAWGPCHANATPALSLPNVGSQHRDRLIYCPLKDDPFPSRPGWLCNCCSAHNYPLHSSLCSYAGCFASGAQYILRIQKAHRLMGSGARPCGYTETLKVLHSLCLTTAL